MSGKKIKKIKCLNKRRVKRLIFNGKRNLSCPFRKLDKLKMNEELVLPNRVGLREDRVDMVGEIIKKMDQKAISNLKITRQKLSKKDLKPNLFKKPQRANQEDQEDLIREEKEVKEKLTEDDIFNSFLLVDLDIFKYL